VAKTKTKTKTDMFNKLKKVLLHSGYQVILTRNISKHEPKAIACGVKGYILPDSLKIFINKNFGINDKVVTLIHELLHEIYPSKSEHQVDKLSKKVFKDLNVSQLGFLQFFVMSPAEIQSMLRSNQLVY